MKMCNIGCLIILCATFQLIHCQFYKFEYTQADETDWTPPAFDPADFAEDRVSGEPCECVMFYQCDKNTKRIIDSGSGLVRWRNGGSDSPKKCEKVGEVCCKPPLWAEKNEEEQPNDFLKPASGTNIETSSEGLNYWNLPDSENEPNGQPRPNPDGNNPDSQPGDQDYYDSANQNGEPQENSPGSLLSCGEKRVSTVDYRNTALRVSGPELETQTKFGEFPWMIMIHQIVRNETDLPTLRLFVCGGSLIHPQIVMTAAHCISGKTKIEDLVVRAGEYDTSTESEPIKHQDRLVDSIVNHPLYNETNPMHDIALIYLKKPFVLADNVNTICLPEEGEIYVGEHCVGTGWGRDGNGKRTETQNLLRKAELPIVPRDQCQQMLRKTRLGKYFRLHESFLCAGGDEMDLCTGDGGGPLTCYNEKTQSEVQVGITSWGIKCGVIGVPGVYTDVLVHRDWITGTVDYLLNGYRP